LAYPAFQVRTQDDENQNQISSVTCRTTPADGGHSMLIQTTPCIDNSPITSCVLVHSDQATPATQQNNGFDCYFNITAPTGANKMLLVQISEDSGFGTTTTWIQPNSNAWMLLTRTDVASGSKKDQVIWHTNIVYHSTVPSNEFFNVKFVYNTFAVFHWYESIGFDAWLSVGGAGGFAFFMVILHTILMLLIGLCIPDDSKFLHSTSAGEKNYQNLVR